MAVLQESHVGPVPGMHSVESVEAEQRRWDIGSVMSRLWNWLIRFFVAMFKNYISEVAQLQAWVVAWVTSRARLMNIKYFTVRFSLL